MVRETVRHRCALAALALVLATLPSQAMAREFRAIAVTSAVAPAPADDAAAGADGSGKGAPYVEPPAIDLPPWNTIVGSDALDGTCGASSDSSPATEGLVGARPSRPLLGGWTAIDPYSPDTYALMDDIRAVAIESNATDILSLPCDDPTILPTNACSQVVAGINYRLWFTLSCPLYGDDDVATSAGAVYVRAAVFVPLPTSSDADSQPEIESLEIKARPGHLGQSEAGDATTDYLNN